MSSFANPATPRASIVLLCYGHWDLTERCLASIEQALGPKLGAEIELVVVDNGSTDETPTRLEAWRDRATIVTLRPNRQFSGGCNAGARAARGDVVIFLNNDTEAEPGVFEALAEQALDPTVGAVGPRLLYRDGTIQHGGVAWYETSSGGVRPFHLFRHESGDLPAASVELELDAVTGACLAVRRSLFLELGGFDEAFRSGFEDLDLCMRLRVQGLRVVYRGDLQLLHDEGLTRGRDNDERENRALFATRWGSLITGDAELLRSTFDAQFNPVLMRHAHPGAEPWGSSVSVEGEIFTLAPNGREARALLRTLAREGRSPAAREWQPVWATPREEDEEWATVDIALAWPKRADALVVHVPAGSATPIPQGAAHVLRVAAPPPAPLPPVAAVWAPSVDSVDALAQGGFAPDRIDVLPPILPVVAAGPGGGGAVAVLPAEDLEATAAILTGLAAFDRPVRLVPTASTPRVGALVQELLPTADLLAPITSEQRLGQLLGGADVVVCGGTKDAFQRTALLAAAVGAAPIVLSRGPAAAYVPDLVHAVPVAETIASALEQALTLAPARHERSRTVGEHCGPAAVEERLRVLIDRAFELRAYRETAVAA